MQKKLIVMAIAATLSVPAVALADTANVTVYGVANLSADYISTGDAAAVGGAKGVSKLVVSSNSSRIGLKGTEDLGGGMSALWQVETLINFDNNAAAVGSRNTYAGLKSETLGTVLLGRHDTPYFMASRRLDVFADGLADSRSMTGGVTGVSANTSFENRLADSLVYITPAFGGLTGAFSRVNTSETRVAQGTASSNIVSLAGMYTAGAIFGSLAYETHAFKSAAGIDTKETGTKLAFGFTQDAFSLGLMYETTSDDLGAAKADLFGHSTIYVSGKYNLASGAVKAAITQAGKLGNAVNTDASQISIGYDHNLSKRTIAYVSYTSISNGDAARYGLAAASSNGGQAATTSGNGADPSALSFGVRHQF